MKRICSATKEYELNAKKFTNGIKSRRGNGAIYQVNLRRIQKNSIKAHTLTWEFVGKPSSQKLVSQTAQDNN